MVILRWFQNLRPKLKKIFLQIKQKKNDKPETLRPIGKKNSRLRDKSNHGDFEIGPNFSETVFPSIILYPLFYCGVSREVSILMCSITMIIIIIMGKQGTVNSLPPVYFQCTNLPTLPI